MSIPIDTPVHGAIVTFEGFIGISKFNEGSLYAELSGVKGHPRLGNPAYVRTSPIVSMKCDGPRVIEIVTVNNTYRQDGSRDGEGV